MELERFFFLDDVDRDLVSRRRSDHRRLGFAVQSQVAKDFGISESCLRNWLRSADVEDGSRPGTTRQESDDLRELKRCNRLLEEESEVLRRAAAYLSQANLKLGQNPK